MKPGLEVALRQVRCKGLSVRVMDKSSSSHSNSVTELQALVSRCNQALARGQHGGLASLLAYRDAGAALRALKVLLPRGQFGPVASQQCGCSKQWRARLMLLDKEWANIEAALQWAKGLGRELGSKAYSVDGALAITRQWRRVHFGNGGVAHQKPRRSRVEGTIPDTATLKNGLSAAKAYIAALEELVADLQSATFEPQELDAPTRLKLQKVAALWCRPGTEGERHSAAHKLLAIARHLGWKLSALLKECDIESPVDWTQ